MPARDPAEATRVREVLVTSQPWVYRVDSGRTLREEDQGLEDTFQQSKEKAGGTESRGHLRKTQLSLTFKESTDWSQVGQSQNSSATATQRQLEITNTRTSRGTATGRAGRRIKRDRKKK